jgi:acyl-CoA thioester hydrolase
MSLISDICNRAPIHDDGEQLVTIRVPNHAGLHGDGNFSGLTGSTGDSFRVAVFQYQVRVYYEDTDSGGVVYYANYLRFMERARTEWLRSLGFEQDRLLKDSGLLFAVRSASLDFLSPARFNDLLEVTAAVQQRTRASLTFHQEITRSDAPDQPLCRGQVMIACVEAATFRPRPIPDFIVKELVDVD